MGIKERSLTHGQLLYSLKDIRTGSFAPASIRPSCRLCSPLLPRFRPKPSTLVRVLAVALDPHSSAGRDYYCAATPGPADTVSAAHLFCCSCKHTTAAQHPITPTLRLMAVTSSRLPSSQLKDPALAVLLAADVNWRSGNKCSWTPSSADTQCSSTAAVDCGRHHYLFGIECPGMLLHCDAHSGQSANTL